MSIKIIKEKINDLKKSLPPQLEDISSLQFKEAILLNYIQRVINRLDDIVRNDINRTESLKRFLEDNWELVKGSLLSYTALPIHPITELLCDIAKYVAENEKVPAISFLMPGIACTSISENYSDLDKLDVAEVLRTYVLGKDYTYLIPASILTEEISLDNLPNPYFDYKLHVENSVFLSEEELKHLSAHSLKATALYALREDYVAFANDKSNLLGKLNEFRQRLKFYSVKGIGQEEVAGEGVYGVIINFIEFWSDLDKTGIPAVVKEEIDLITQLGTDKDKNETETIKTCLSTRHETLEAAMEGNKGILEAITLSPEKRESGIEKTIERFNTASADLQQLLENKQYTGQDRLGIKAKILNELGIELSFADFPALTASLKGLQAEDVSTICALPQAPEKIVKAIDTIGNLVILASVELNDEVLSALLQGIKNKINLIIKSPQDFSSFLILLNTNQCELVCGILKAELTAMIESNLDFFKVLSLLSPEQCKVVCEALKETLPVIIKSSHDFFGAILFLNSDQRMVVCEALKAELPVIIKSSDAFSQLLFYLNPEQRTIVYEALKERLPAMIKSGWDYYNVISRLNPEQRTALDEALKETFRSSVENLVRFGFFNNTRTNSNNNQTTPEAASTSDSDLQVLECNF